MAFDKIEYGRVTLDKYFDVRYGSEKYFEYIGREAYRALPKLMYNECVEHFMNFFETVGEDWKGITVKIKRHDDVYRDAYIRMRKKPQLVGGEQLWDAEIYDIETLTEAYAYAGDCNSMYRTLLGFVERSYFRYEHDSGMISFFRISNGREHILFSMKLEEWKKEAVYQGHIRREEENNFFGLCDSIASGKRDISMDIGTSLCLSTDEIKDCHITAATLMREGKPFLTMGMIGLVGINGETDMVEDASAMLDPLTKLYNKKAIQDRVKEIIENKSMEHFALFIMDVDNFKEVNDNFGHMYGDQVLERVAGVISDVLGDKGVAGRIGGDEFMGIINNVEEREEIRYILRSIRSRVQYLYTDVPGVNVSCSIGATRYPVDCDTYDKLFNCADKCLYIAKEKGKNRYIIYQEDLHGAVRSESRGTSKIEHIRRYSASSIVKEAIGRLYRDKEKAIPEVLKFMAEELRFDRAAVYYGPELKRLYSYGKKCSDTAFWGNNEDYLAHFNGDGIFSANTMFKIEASAKDIYDKFKKQHTECFLQVILGEPEHVCGYVSFECCSSEKRFTEATVNAVDYISRMIYEILRKDEEISEQNDEQ